MSLLFVLFFGFAQHLLSINAELVALSSCTNPAIESMANPPELYRLVGTWYIYITDHGPIQPDIRCGCCQIKAKTSSLTEKDVQCITIIKRYVPKDGSYYLQNQYRYVTGTLTLASNKYTLTTADGFVNPEIVVTHFDPLKGSMAVKLCNKIHMYHPWPGSDHYFSAAIGLAKCGPVSGFTDVSNGIAAEYKNADCIKSTFDFAKTGIVIEDAATDEDTRTTGLEAAGVDCTSYTLAGTAPYQRYLKVFTEKKSWADAKTACKALGSTYTLAMVDTQTILDKIKDPLLATANEAWIGLKHIAHDATKATLEWCNPASCQFQIKIADSAVTPTGTFTKFANDDKKNWDNDVTALDGKDCFYLKKADATFGWHEAACTDTKPYICECWTC